MLADNLSMQDLFMQLGLDHDEESMEAFFEAHAGLDPATRLEDASFWSESQATFIRSEWAEDAEWAELIDQLNIRLR
ncbi:DUF2789 family protein [Aliiglaciecola sp. LCG003]|uniref:DUF2789 family protein n=1 Tax=Aliiglaciecola sp. LCG003 TaxID=3053655 RepID=UPI002573FCCC|nr:DUF2789 family protein [Aliiglaciecola sp. LCG003]WJG10422.1 DUF2789 family protein [Aliiglaciecola sp. LCG003]